MNDQTDNSHNHEQEGNGNSSIFKIIYNSGPKGFLYVLPPLIVVLFFIFKKISSRPSKNIVESTEEIAKLIKDLDSIDPEELGSKIFDTICNCPKATDPKEFNKLVLKIEQKFPSFDLEKINNYVSIAREVKNNFNLWQLDEFVGSLRSKISLFKEQTEEITAEVFSSDENFPHLNDQEKRLNDLLLASQTLHFNLWCLIFKSKEYFVRYYSNGSDYPILISNSHLKNAFELANTLDFLITKLSNSLSNK